MGTGVALYRVAYSSDRKSQQRSRTDQNGSNGPVELVPMPNAMPSWELSPREPHLYDYLLILRKHQWLILSFMLSVVTIVAIATFQHAAGLCGYRADGDRQAKIPTFCRFRASILTT